MPASNFKHTKQQPYTANKRSDLCVYVCKKPSKNHTISRGLGEKAIFGFRDKISQTQIGRASTGVDAQGQVHSQVLIPSCCLSHAQHFPLKFEGCLEPRYIVDWGRTPQPRPPASQRAQQQRQQQQAKERASHGEHTPLGNKDRDILYSRRQALSGLLARRLKVARGLVSGGNRDWGQILGELPSRESRHIHAAALFPGISVRWAAECFLAPFASFRHPRGLDAHS